MKTMKDFSKSWMSVADAAVWSGLSKSMIQKLIRDKYVVSSNCKLPGKSKGKRLVCQGSLNAYIEEGINLPPSQISINTKIKN